MLSDKYEFEGHLNIMRGYLHNRPQDIQGKGTFEWCQTHFLS